MGLDDKEQQEQAKPDSVGMDLLPTARRNAIDLNNEIAGHDTGRSKKFLNAESLETLRERNRKEEQLSALMRAMQDREYAQLYRLAQNTVNRADTASDQALKKLARETDDANDVLEDMRDRAAELPDGRKVFRDTKGRLLAEDGTDVTAQAGSVKGLTMGSPSWEEYRLARERIEDLERRRREVEEYRRDVLDPARARLGDEDNPPSKEEIKEIISHAEEAMNDDVREEFERIPPQGMDKDKPASGSAASEYVGTADLNAPLLKLDFATASADGSYDPSSPAPPATTSSPKPV